MQDRQRAWGVVGCGVAAALLVALGLAALADGPPQADNPYLDDQFLLGLSAVPVGLFVAWRRPDHPLGWLLYAAGMAAWGSFSGATVIGWVILHTPELEWLGRAILAVTVSLWILWRALVAIHVPLVYPDGPPVGWLRLLWWAGTVAAAITCIAHARFYTFDAFNGVPATGQRRVAELVLPWGHRALFVLSIAAILTMLRRVALMDPATRRQHRAFAAITAVLLLPAVHSLWVELGGGSFEPMEQVELWAGMALPVVLAAGILRHGVLDIQVAVRRVTVYGVAALLLAGTYVGVVEVLALVVQEDTGIARVTATGTVAVLAMPVYMWAQRCLDRRIFGNRHDPAQVLRALGETLQHSPQGRDALSLVVETVARELRLPFVAVDLNLDGEPLRSVSTGAPAGPEHRVVLTDRGRPVGELVTCGRTPREPLTDSELSILGEIARPVGVIAGNVLLTEELRVSRRLLVHAREEERRRIRRDLHDGLGPTLASVSLGIGTAAQQLGTDTELGALLHDLETEVRDAVDDIRRLVYDLRPPALDEVGLVQAVRDHARALTERSGELGSSVTVTVEATPPTVPLPAAVEVAVYRIALEAITNVARHAQALHCRVRLRADRDQVELDIEDDGRGIVRSAPVGVGLRSMRDRAAELGGSVAVEPVLPHGTRVRAMLPLQGALP